MASHPYVKLARETVRRYLAGESLPRSGGEVDAAAEDSLWSPKRACFVSIKTLDGDLRGCIGTISPAQPSLEREIVANAVSASTRDPRFSPMTARELDRVKFSVDVLGAPEAVTDIGQLAPKVWGVIVTRGMARGVLLPDLEGVGTVDDQLRIAAGKAGIRDLTGVRIERFKVDRYLEDEA
jgi:AmmeMemoRadiSam system protein A